MLPLDEARGTDEPSMREQRTNKKPRTKGHRRPVEHAFGQRVFGQESVERASRSAFAYIQSCLRVEVPVDRAFGRTRLRTAVVGLRADASSDSSREGLGTEGPCHRSVFGQESIL